MNFIALQIATIRAAHIVKRAIRKNRAGAQLCADVNRAINILVKAGADFNASVSFVLNIRRSMRAA